MAGTAQPGYDRTGGSVPIPDNPAATAIEEQPNLGQVLATPPPPEALVDSLIGEKSEVGQPMVRFVHGAGGADATQPGSSASQSDIRDPGV